MLESHFTEEKTEGYFCVPSNNRLFRISLEYFLGKDILDA